MGRLKTLKPRLATLQSPLEARTPTRRRIRGRKLQTIRERLFAEHPLCVHCESAGRVRIATEVDHVVPLHCGGEDADSNRQGLCAECHAAKTREDLSYRGRAT